MGRVLPREKTRLETVPCSTLTKLIESCPADFPPCALASMAEPAGGTAPAPGLIATVAAARPEVFRNILRSRCRRSGSIPVFKSSSFHLALVNQQVAAKTGNFSSSSSRNQCTVDASWWRKAVRGMGRMCRHFQRVAMPLVTERWNLHGHFAALKLVARRWIRAKQNAFCTRNWSSWAYAGSLREGRGMPGWQAHAEKTGWW